MYNLPAIKVISGQNVVLSINSCKGSLKTLRFPIHLKLLKI